VWCTGQQFGKKQTLARDIARLETRIALKIESKGQGLNNFLNLKRSFMVLLAI
jgi:hypothetical protein